MNYENFPNSVTDSKEEIIVNESIIQDNRQTGSLSLPYSKKNKNISSNSLDFDIISEEEINNYSKSLYAKKKNYKTDIKNMNNNHSITEKNIENNKNIKLELNSFNQKENINQNNKVVNSYINYDLDNENEEKMDDEIESKINILKESILIDPKNKNDSGMWSSFSNKLSSFKNYLKYNVITTNKQLKFSDLTYLNLFDKSYAFNQFSTNEFDLALNKIFSFTYRTHFTELIPKDNLIFNSDCGWGCMIRAGQMILSKAILEYKILNLGKETCISNEDIFDLKVNVLKLFFDNMISFDEKDFLDKEDFGFFFKNYTKLLNEEERKYNLYLGNVNSNSEEIFCEQDFQNKFSENNLSIKGLYAPFSIQNITKLGILYDAGPGIWFSDAKVIKIFKEIEEQLNIFNGMVNIFSFDGGVIYEKEIIDECFEEIKFECFENCINKKDIDNNINGNKIDFINKHTNYENKKLDINEENYSNNEIIDCEYEKNKFDEKYEDINLPYEHQTEKSNFICENICLDCLQKFKINNQDSFKNQILEIDFHLNNEENINKNNNKNIINYDKEYQNSKILKRFYKMKKSGFLFISVRHGLNSIEKEYHNSIKQFFKIPNNLGIIGGKANSAFYFVGEYQDKLVYLDPHLSQRSIENLNQLYQNGFETYEPKYFYYLDIKNMSPGFTMGFYFTDVAEYKNLKNALSIHSELKFNLFSFEKLGDVKKFKKKISVKKPEEMKFKEVIEDDFNVIDIDDDF